MAIQSHSRERNLICSCIAIKNLFCDEKTTDYYLFSTTNMFSVVMASPMKGIISLCSTSSQARFTPNILWCLLFSIWNLSRRMVVRCFLPLITTTVSMEFAISDKPAPAKKKWQRWEDMCRWTWFVAREVSSQQCCFHLHLYVHSRIIIGLPDIRVETHALFVGYWSIVYWLLNHCLLSIATVFVEAWSTLRLLCL